LLLAAALAIRAAGLLSMYGFAPLNKMVTAWGAPTINTAASTDMTWMTQREH
jgi:hypothetical protein